MRFSIVVVVAVALGRIAAADPSVPDRSERVIAAGRLWAEAKYFHPYLAYKAIDWDAAFVAALPKLEAATTADTYKKAIAEMLNKLGDPVTRVRDDTAPAPRTASSPLTSTPALNVVLVDLAAFTQGGWNYADWTAKAKTVIDDAAKGRVLVIDGRAPVPALARQAIEMIDKAFPAIDSWPLERTIEHHGYRSQDDDPAGSYYSLFVTTGARAAKPAGVGITHVVFIADAGTEIAPAIHALQAQGRATIVAPGQIPEDGVVSTKRVDVIPGVSVQLRLGEMLSGPPVTDVRVPVAELRTRAIAVARSKINLVAAPIKRITLNLPALQPRDDADYAMTALPSRELRVLAGIRLWAVLDRFFPYRYLVPDWDKALATALPKLEAATTADAYQDALKELAARSGDGHVGVYHPAQALTRGAVSIMPRLVEGRLVVHRLLDGIAVEKGLNVGDVIETIDGRPTATVLAEKRKLTAGSTDEARDQIVARIALVGPDGSTVKLGIRNTNNVRYELVLTRKALTFAAMWAPVQKPHWKKLANNIGYIDLTELTPPEVDAAFKDLATTKAIVFDMRGYPKGTAWLIAPRINVKGAKYGAQFFRPYVLPSDPEGQMQDMRVRFLQPLPALPPGASLYRGKIVVLIDDRAVSQSEHSCLFYQEAAGATFIGSPTHGANGDITRGRLPGGLRFTFTGQEVKHVDGKQLQRVGIQPHITIRQTLAGLRAGKDEVLDRALAFLATGK